MALHYYLSVIIDPNMYLKAVLKKSTYKHIPTYTPEMSAIS